MLDLVRRGTVAGLFAGATVALVVLIHDLILLEPLATPKLLAKSLLGAPVAVSSEGGTLGWIADALGGARDLALYTATHFAVFAAVGLLGAWLFGPGGWPANLATGALFGAVVGTALLYAAILVLAPDFVSAPAWPFLLLTNAVAGIVLVAQLVEPPEPAAG